MYLIQQFRDGKRQQSEVLAEFSIVIFLTLISLWQNDAFALLKFLFMVDKKQKKTLHICRC